jgi:hypothetical protein
MQRIEKRHFEDFRQLSKQLSTPARTIRTVVDARQHHYPAPQEVAVPTTFVDQPTFCLD